QAFAPAVLRQLSRIEAGAFQHHPKLVLARPLVGLLSISRHHCSRCSGLFAPSIQGGISNACRFHQLRHRPAQGRHHLPHHPLPMLYRITRHTALTSAHRPRLIESTHTTTILTRRGGWGMLTADFWLCRGSELDGLLSQAVSARAAIRSPSWSL